TLTSRLDGTRRDAVLAGLTEMFADLVAEPVRFDSLCLFAQPSRGEPFRIIRRHPLGRPA
ncbi:MAG: DUF1045 domain-containing protein, partial [Rhodospirillales bacterium]|nr:DUF1045 domain-containing protein [Rhodospirillales bacterium]